MATITVNGGYKYQQRFVLSVAQACIEWFWQLSDKEHSLIINIELVKELEDCYGDCVDGDEDNCYNITIATSTRHIRDLVATIVHEMVHLKQYVTGEWEDDGEKEASDLEYELTDKFWKWGKIGSRHKLFQRE